jgi:hypothetical protein
MSEYQLNNHDLETVEASTVTVSMEVCIYSILKIAQL